ncbi:hypothetical protein F4820DRAFT_431257 [Hypoxylon rubiginosum]|uniref:Uncharacterized protein n=1 Tax=Hypoxylon rubiginosum TaxID=110542 RepID=A0ACB9YRZ2_9PEZI|nr:hypothetical protein F4820DRAFT_431257 [Hypoxylon rubiginosum]
MFFKSAATLLAAALLAPASALFSCHETEGWGYVPKCCQDINGQFGTNCLTAFQQGVTNPTWDCNEYVYNITGCCQSIGLKNSYTNNTIDLCAMSIDS